VNINASGAPFVTSGNTVVAVLDPTALALADRSLMNFTGMVASTLQDRFKGMPVAGGAAGGGALGFAPDGTGRIEAAQDAFAGVPSLAMAYASEPRRMIGKAPVAPVYDTVVWASGFGGVRHQARDGLLQKADDSAFGGVIGIDRQTTPDLRLGVFAGAGSGQLKTDFGLQKVDSDYVFGGGYGRFDQRSYYVDFTLTGGAFTNKSARSVSNNTAPNGLELAGAKYDGWFVSPDVTYGLRIPMADYSLTPKARLRYVAGWLDGYSETGSQQGLVVGKRDIRDIEERVGVELSNTRPASFGGTLKTTVEVSGIGLQRLGDNTINTVLLGQNLAFTTPGHANAYGGGAGLTLDWRPKVGMSLFAAAEGTLMNDHSASIAAKGGMRMGF